MIITINMTLFGHDCTYVMIVLYYCLQLWTWQHVSVCIVRLVLYTD